MKIKSIVKFTEDFENKEEIILRDHLAMERTKLANERTLLSYIRTSLYLLLGGLALIGLKEISDLKIIGYISVLMSVVFLFIGLLRYFQLKKHLKSFFIKQQ